MIDNIQEKQSRDDRRQAMIEAILPTLREALGEKIDAVEADAAASVDETEAEGDAKPVKAKLSISLSWLAGEPSPEVTIKAKHSLSKSITYTAQTEGN